MNTPRHVILFSARDNPMLYLAAHINTAFYDQIGRFQRCVHNIINYIIDHARTRPANSRCAHSAATTMVIKAIEDGFSQPRTMMLLLTITRCVHNIINYIIDHARTRPVDDRCAR